MKLRLHPTSHRQFSLFILPISVILITFLIAVRVKANPYSTLNWNDLELKSNYQLNQTIWFQSDLKLSQSHPLQLIDIQADLEQVFFLVFKNLNCGDDKLKSDLILFNPEPEDTTHDKSIGIQILENCYLGIYLEPAFYYNKSIFQKIDKKNTLILSNQSLSSQQKPK